MIDSDRQFNYLHPQFYRLPACVFNGLKSWTAVWALERIKAGKHCVLDYSVVMEALVEEGICVPGLRGELCVSTDYLERFVG